MRHIFLQVIWLWVEGWLNFEMFTHIRFKVEWKVVLQLDRNDLVKKTFESPNLRRNPFNKFKIFRTVRMERVFKQIFILVLSGDEFRSPCQLYRTDWFNFQTEISRHFVTGDWNGQIIQEKRWTIYPEAFRVGHLTKPFPGPKFPDILLNGVQPSNLWLLRTDSSLFSRKPFVTRIL